MTQIWTKPWRLKIEANTFYVFGKVSNSTQRTGLGC